MRILFSPEYSGRVFTQTPGACVMMDTVVANMAGLINLLELRMGLHYEEVTEQERMAHYYDAVSQYMASTPGNVMAESFKTAGLGTAKAMLTWRDELRSANWDFDGAEISRRLEALIGVEEIFRKQNGCDMAGRLHIVTDQVLVQKLDCKDLTIVMPCAKELLKPTTRNLLDALETCGAKFEMQKEAEPVKSNLRKVRQMIENGQKNHIRLTEGDASLQIWKFPDERAACEYLAHEDMNGVDVWINADNKQMDNWLTLMNKPKTGSVTADSAPQLTQLFVMGFGLFANPLNVNTLVEWLNMPVHPIDPHFRYKLANSIANNGGYRNEDCKKLTQLYLDGKFVILSDEQKALTEEQKEEIRQKDAKERKRLTEVFLPSQTSTKDILTEDVRSFASELADWARQRAHLMSNNSDDSQWAEQLMTVAGMSDAMRILLDTVTAKSIDYKTIDSWMSTIFQKGAYTNAVAEVGCRTVIDSPAKMASVAQKTVWMGMDGDAANLLECSFLYPSEKKQLTDKQFMSPWKEDDENRYNEHMMQTPLRMTQKQLILVTCERRGGEPTQKHPLIVRLEQQIDNFDKFVTTPRIGVKHMTNVDVVNHDSTHPELHFDHADKIKWPDHLSPTSIETLVEYPFDYLMWNLLNITASAKAQMTNVKTTMGNVAHGVIEELFAPRDGQRFSTPDDITKLFEADYDDTFKRVVEAKGAILQLAENKLRVQLLKEQLRNCLNTLVEIIKDNDLKVTGCERHVEGKLVLNLPMAYDKDGNVKERDIVGFIDMTLEDKDGHPVVFDFKWSRWDGYKWKLMDNRSVQLELYRWMLGKEQRDEVKRVAYFLMPEARLYSKEKFIGNNCSQVNAENDDNIVEQLRQSIRYRKEQITSGVVETDGVIFEMQYLNDTVEKNLFRLVEGAPKLKEGNPLSPYGLFSK